MIEKIADNKTNQEELNLNPTNLIVEKLDYYRSLFGKISELSDSEFEELSKSIATFFNLKSVKFTDKPPEYLFRISNNNRILQSQGKELGFLNKISQLLAPHLKYCNYNRCNIPEQQVLYCAMDESTAYWETKPQKGDIITISFFKLKEDAKLNCSIIKKEKTNNPDISYQLQEVYYHLEDFFSEVYTREISRDTPKEYIFSSLLSSEMLFYPIESPDNIEAIIYPSVQRKKHGLNFALKNDLIFKYYDLVEATTRFIIEEYKDKQPNEDGPTTDDVIASIRCKNFDFKNDKIKYSDKENELFSFLRDLQVNLCKGTAKQVRYEKPIPVKDMKDLAKIAKNEHSKLNGKYGQNCRVNVIYKDDIIINGIKFKKIKDDFRNGKIKLIKITAGNKEYKP